METNAEQETKQVEIPTLDEVRGLMDHLAGIESSRAMNAADPEEKGLRERDAEVLDWVRDRASTLFASLDAEKDPLCGKPATVGADVLTCRNIAGHEGPCWYVPYVEAVADFAPPVEQPPKGRFPLLMVDNFPRRNRMDHWSPGERAIQSAVDAVELMGADVALTDAVILLGKAKDRVADYVDAQLRAAEVPSNA